MPIVILGQDEVDCFAAWVSIEYGLPEYVEGRADTKVILNYAIVLLCADFVIFLIGKLR